MNKFEQVSSDGRQMSLVGYIISDVWGVSCLISGGGGDDALDLTVQGLVIFTWGPQWTDTSENIAFPQFRWRMVKIPAVLM